MPSNRQAAGRPERKRLQALRSIASKAKASKAPPGASPRVKMPGTDEAGRSRWLTQGTVREIVFFRRPDKDPVAADHRAADQRVSVGYDPKTEARC